MIDLKIVLLLLAVHFVADFVLQSHWMADNKSKRWDALGLHALTYTSYLALCTLDWRYVVINGVLHYWTDAITSRINKRLWDAKQVHYFFVSVGFDQLIHTTTLLLIWRWMYG
jgi:hypothetical protein